MDAEITDLTHGRITVRLIADAIELQQHMRQPAHLVAIPGTGRAIAIGTPAEVAQLLSIAAPASKSLRHIGGLMANVMFNMAQRGGAGVVSPESLKQLQVDWDAAVRAEKQASPDAIGLLREARAVLETWKDMVPAVSLCVDIDKALAAAPAAPAVEPTFQARVQPWMMACFGAEISGDKMERNDRFTEESLELVQSLGMGRERVLALVDYVYGRPAGDPPQEVGGVMVTLAALCLAQGMDMHVAAETELARIWTKVEAIRAKQATKPTGSALPMAVIPAPAGMEPTQAARDVQGSAV